MDSVLLKFRGEGQINSIWNVTRVLRLTHTRDANIFQRNLGGGAKKYFFQQNLISDVLNEHRGF